MANSELVQALLKDYSSQLSSKVSSGESIRIYYKNGGDTVNVLTVISRDDNPELLKDIYSVEAKMFKKHVLKEESELNLNFRVIPTYKNPLSTVVPPSFKRYNAKPTIS